MSIERVQKSVGYKVAEEKKKKKKPTPKKKPYCAE